MSADITIPTGYSLGLSGAVDLDLDNICINNIPIIHLDSESTVVLKGDKANPVAVSTDSKLDLNSVSKVDLGLDNIQITRLPQINLQLSAKPTRVHFPVNYKLSVGTMGIELFAFAVCGESMVIIEDYHPHATEEC